MRAPGGQNITVEARDLGGEATLSHLRIESKLAAQVQPGESLYGVVATGTTTSLVMNDVRIEMTDAVAGPNGAEGRRRHAGSGQLRGGNRRGGAPSADRARVRRAAATIP